MGGPTVKQAEQSRAAERLKKLETSEDLRQTKRTSEYI